MGGYLDSGGSGNAPQNGGEGGLLLSPTNGWVDGASNAPAIQGALFADADSTSIKSLRSNFTGGRACIQGTAAKVDMASTPCATRMFTPPAQDCYDQYWGAEVALNLNQPVPGGEALPFDAGALVGFAFEISGDIVPGPSSLRFQVRGPDGKFCNYPAKKLRNGPNTVLFSELAINCWNNGLQTAESAKSGLIRIEWWVVTNSSAITPYDLCVSNIRALRN